jgi:hypothetical protein
MDLGQNRRLFERSIRASKKGTGEQNDRGSSNEEYERVRVPSCASRRSGTMGYVISCDAFMVK